MLLVSRAMFSGVAPPDPGLSTGSRRLAAVLRRSVEQPRDRGADELDVTDLLGADALDEVLVGLRLRPAEVDGLEQVLHHRAHLAELTAEALLQGVGGGGIGLVLHDRVDELLKVEVHGVSTRIGVVFGPRPARAVLRRCTRKRMPSTPWSLTRGRTMPRAAVDRRPHSEDPRRRMPRPAGRGIRPARPYLIDPRVTPEMTQRWEKM